MATAPSVLTLPTKPTTRTRVRSLDVFRGMTIAGMILVNDPGTWDHVYAPLLHAEWNGCTPTDLIFPFFLFIVGVSMVFSFSKRLDAGATRRGLLLHTLRRSAIIFGIGLFLHAYPYFDFSRLRIMGVLQRIALCYLLASVVFLYTGVKGRLAVFLSLLAGYWALMKFVPVPGFGAGNLTPDGNLAAYIDRLVLGTHLYRPMWDPEGLLSSLPAVGTVLFGTFVGEWLDGEASPAKKVRWMFQVGVGIAIAGLIFNYWFPINKNLWTSSYVLYTAGLGTLTFAACYWIIDMRKWRTWAVPFEIFGMNAIASYAIATFLAKEGYLIRFGHGGRSAGIQEFIYSHWFAPLGSAKLASLLFAIAFVLLNLAIMSFFWRKKIFIKI